MAKRFEIPDGYTARGFSFEVAWPQDRSAVLSHFGARRKAKNWAIGKVKADMDARKANPEHESIRWNLPALRKEWNAIKATVAPWWAQNSKEAYSSGIADAVRALDNWRASRKGERAGKPVGFPRFESKRKGHDAVRFTTGTIRVETDRRTITLPVVGRLVSKENTRRLERHVRNGTGPILSATLSRRGDRLFVSFTTIIRQQRPVAASPQARAGVDLGPRTLAAVADSNGKITEYPNPAPLRTTLAARRRAGRQMSRRIVGSKGWRAAKATLQAMDLRAANIRKDAAHKLTTDLARTYGTVVIEDLDVAAMKRGMGRRAFRRSVSDAAIGALRPMLTYKTAWHAGTLVVADRWYPSSKVHHGCGCRLIEPRKLAKHLACAVTGAVVDRDVNAAMNLRDWPERTASTGAVDARAPQVASDGDGGQAPDSIPGRGRNRKTSPQGEARSVEARTVTVGDRDGTSRRGAA